VKDIDIVDIFGLEISVKIDIGKDNIDPALVSILQNPYFSHALHFANFVTLLHLQN